MSMDRFAAPNAVQVHVSLDDIKPAIWRRLVVPLDFTLRDLHLVLQAAFGWMNAHLYEFRVGGLRYGDAAVANADGWEGDSRTFDDAGVRVRDFMRKPGTRFEYVYDFGDEWVHTVVLEKQVAVEPTPKVASLIAGARARPPEDVGGTSGYQDFLEALLNPAHEEHRAIRRWAGGHFDPEWFDFELINDDVSRALRPAVKRRPHQPKPKKGKEP
jgi:hypothetical protein